MVFGSILGAVGLGASILGDKGGKDASESKQRTGFDALPADVQKAYLKTYLPAVLEQFNAPRTQIPMARAEKPTDIFGSQELFKYQQFKDAQRLRNTMSNQAPAVTPDQTSRAGINQDDFIALIQSIAPTIGGVKSSAGYDPFNAPKGTAPASLVREEQNRVLQEAFKRFLGGQ